MRIVTGVPVWSFRMCRRTLLTALVMLLAEPALAAVPVSPDAQYDKTGDGVVDAADWKEMSDKEKTGYARASMRVLGQNPDAVLEDGKTLAGQYLDSLKSIYGD